MKNIHKSNVRVKNSAFSTDFDMVQFDTGNVLELTIKDITIPEGTTAKAFFLKPSGKFLYKETGVTIIGNVVTCPVDNQAIAEVGLTKYQVKLYSGTDIISTFGGSLHVKPSYQDTSAEKSDTIIPAFEQAVIDGVERIEAAKNAAVEEVGNVIDPTLTQKDKAADAKATGDALQGLSESLILLQMYTDKIKMHLIVDEYYNTVTGNPEKDVNKQYLRTDKMMIDTDTPYFILNDYSDTDRIDVMYFSESNFISKVNLYNTSFLFNLVENAPSGATIFALNIRSKNKSVECRNAKMDDIVGYHDGYVDISGNIVIGVRGNNGYKMRIIKVKKGQIVNAECKGNSSISAISFYDSNLKFLKNVKYISNVTDYMAITPQDGYAIASTITVGFDDFVFNIIDRNTIEIKNVAFPYNIYMKDGIGTEGTYVASRCIYVPKGKVLVFNAYASSNADAITDENERTKIASGISADLDYWYSYCAEEESIVRLCSRDNKDYFYEIITPNPKLVGKRLYALGDSYIDGNVLGGSTQYAHNHVWVNLLAIRNGMSIVNYGVNGTTVAKSSVNNCISDRIDKLDSDFDVFIFDGGRNDFSKGVEIGDIRLSNTDKNTFSGALQYIINKIYALNPEALILAHPCWVSSNGATYGDTEITQTTYADTFKDVCKNNGVLHVDTSNCGIAVTQQKFREKYFMSATDISHLNAKGHAKYVTYIEGLLAAI